MPDYEITSPTGERFIVTAPEGATQEQVLAYARENAPKPNVIADVAKSGMSGLRQGAGAMADMALAFTPVGGVTRALSNPTGNPTTALMNPFGNLMTRRESKNAYEPQTAAGEYARTVGQFAPNAFAGGGGIAARAANVFAPAIASETAGQLARASGVGPGGEVAARVAGGFAGGAGTALRRPRVPSTGQPRIAPAALRGETKRAYKDVEDSGVVLNGRAVDDLVDGISAEMQAALINPKLHPKASAMLEFLQSFRGKEMSLPQADQLRQVIGRDVAGATDKAERMLGAKMIKGLDEWLSAAGEGEVSAGDPTRGVSALTRARDLNTRTRKVDDVSKAVGKAHKQAAKTGSGGNIDNALRQKIDNVFERTKSWTDDERALLDKIVTGGGGQNALRQLGKMSPSGNGLTQLLHVFGAVSSGGLTLPIAGGGALAKALADRTTKRRVDDLIKLIAAGGEAPPKAPKVPAQERAINIFREQAPAMSAASALSATSANAGERRQR